MRRSAKVTVGAAFGFSPADEYYLWGLLALTFNQPAPTRVFSATPYFCLRKLGLDHGGKNYADFKSALERISGLSYRCSSFYDAVRGERRRVGFQFLSYSLPISDDSSRAWQFTWNDLFFEHCAATGGKLFFDLTSDTFRGLDPASRRLFLLLHKVFWRKSASPLFDLKHLAVNVLGFSSTRPVFKLKFDMTRCIERLLQGGLIVLPAGVSSVAGLFEKRAKARYSVQFHRGPYFEQHSIARVAHQPACLADNPLFDPLRTIGFEDRQIRWILKSYPAGRIELWSDVTLAKLERDGARAFSVAPQAYLLDNLKHERTRPDWYLELKKQEHERHRQAAVDKVLAGLDMDEVEAAYRAAKSRAWEEFRGERSITRDEFHRVAESFAAIHRRRMSDDVAAEQAAQDAERHLSAGFSFPEFREWLLREYVTDPGACSGAPTGT